MAALDGKVVLVTGAARGIGLGVAAVLTELGARVTMVDVLEQGAAAAEKLGADFKRVDVSDEKQVTALVEAIVSRHGKLDGAVNNAGIIGPGNLEDDAPLRRVVEVNLLGVFLCMRAQLRAMTREKRGSILNVSSINGVRGTTGSPMYAATKRAVISLSKSAAAQAGPLGIRVNTLLPGNVSSEMLTQSYPSANLRVALAQLTPLRRLGKGTDVGHAAAFLLSDAASYVTGQTLAVDGGALAAWESL